MEENKREVAYKLRISDIISARYIQQEGWEPNYLIVEDKEVKKVNVIGNIIAIEEEQSYYNVIIDDGSGKIPLRFFENRESVMALSIGDIVMLIGRPREFAKERYILAEIIKKLDNPGWALLRKIELEAKKEAKKEEFVEEQKASDEEGKKKEGIYNKIKEMDKGQGVLIEDIAAATGAKAEQIVKELLMNGDIFEISPGKVKVLE